MNLRERLVRNIRRLRADTLLQPMRIELDVIIDREKFGATMPFCYRPNQYAEAIMASVEDAFRLREGVEFIRMRRTR